MKKKSSHQNPSDHHVEKNPHSTDLSAAIHWYNKGVSFQQQGRMDDAVQAYQQALSKNHRFAEAMNNLGNVLKDLGRCQEAIAQFKRALRLRPNDAMLLSNLGQALDKCDQNTQALLYLKKAVHADPRSAEAFLNLGNALRHHDPDQAIAAYRKALSINPKLAYAYNNLGALLEEQGHFDLAREALVAALRLKPTFGEAHRHLANLEPHAEITEHILAMEALMSDSTISSHDKLHIGFGLGKAYEDLGDYARAMDLFQRANRLTRASFSYSLDTDRRFVQRLIHSFDAERLAADPAAIWDETPIFIVGMPRSGTSLVEQILSSHPDVFGAGEQRYLPQALEARCPHLSGEDTARCLERLNRSGLTRIGHDYLKRLRSHDRRAKYITDKLPHNFLRIGLIRLALPKARIIHCTRDPVDTCLSIYKNYFITDHAYAYDQQELGHYYRLYKDLMAHWHAVAGNAIYDISYEDLVANPETQMRALLAFCGLDWDKACLAFHENQRRVATASSAQVRRPIYNSSVALWKHFESGLSELLAVLQAEGERVLGFQMLDPDSAAP